MSGEHLQPTLTAPESHRAAAILKARELLASNPVYLDTETTGVNKDAEIVEIALIDSDGSVLYDTLVRPFRPVPPDAEAIHGITQEMLAGAKPFYAHWQNIRSLLFGRQLAIYNAEFDLRLLQQTYSQYGQPWRENFSSTCVMKIYSEFFGEWDSLRNDFRSISLDRAAKQMKLVTNNRHRANDDAALTRDLLLALAGTNE